MRTTEQTAFQKLRNYCKMTSSYCIAKPLQSDIVFYFQLFHIRISLEFKRHSINKYNNCPVDTGSKLNVHKTFRRRPGRLLNVLCTFNLRPVSTGCFLICTGNIALGHRTDTASSVDT